MLEGLATEIARLLLETARTAGLLWAAPLSFQDAPPRARAIGALVLALVAHGAAAPSPQGIDSFGPLVLGVISEVFLGGAMGMVVRLVLSVAEGAGDYISPMLGFGTVTLFDPHNSGATPIVSKILLLFMLLLGLLLGLHRAVLGSLIMSFQVIPPGTLINSGLAAPVLVKMAALALEAGLRVSMPVVGMLLLVQMALAFVSRAAPTLQIFSIGFAVTLTVGAAVLIIALPDMGRALAWEMSQVERRIAYLLYALTPG